MSQSYRLRLSLIACEVKNCFVKNILPPPITGYVYAQNIAQLMQSLCGALQMHRRTLCYFFHVCLFLLLLRYFAMLAKLAEVSIANKLRQSVEDKRRWRVVVACGHISVDAFQRAVANAFVRYIRNESAAFYKMLGSLHHRAVYALHLRFQNFEIISFRLCLSHLDKVFLNCLQSKA